MLVLEILLLKMLVLKILLLENAAPKIKSENF